MGSPQTLQSSFNDGLFYNILSKVACILHQHGILLNC